VRAGAPLYADRRGDVLAACVGEVVGAALRQLESVEVLDPTVVLAAGGHCTLELDRLIARARQDRARLRIGDSLRIEASRLLEGPAHNRPVGLDARVLASAGDDSAWLQACQLALASLDAGETQGAVACAVCGHVVCAFAIADDEHDANVNAGAEVGDAQPGVSAPVADTHVTVSWLCQALDDVIAASWAAGGPVHAHRSDAHVRVADLNDEPPRQRRRSST
jgi:hypothetical protein